MSSTSNLFGGPASSPLAPRAQPRPCPPPGSRVSFSVLMELQHRSLEQLLLDQGRISPEDLRKVRKLHQERGERLERLLLDLGFISEEDLQPLLSSYLGGPHARAERFPGGARALGA